MNNKHDDGIRPPTGLPAVSAGEFSQWLHATEAMLESGNGAANVPCGSCRGCCRSSMFIHIRPEETQTIQRIPRRLLVPAPGLPKGHLLMGYTLATRGSLLRPEAINLTPPMKLSIGCAFFDKALHLLPLAKIRRRCPRAPSPPPPWARRTGPKPASKPRPATASMSRSTTAAAPSGLRCLSRDQRPKAPVVILIHEIFGLSDWAKEMADELAAQGFIVIAPDLLSAWAPTAAAPANSPARTQPSKPSPALDPDGVNADLDAAADYGKTFPAANGKLAVAASAGAAASPSPSPRIAKISRLPSSSTAPAPRMSPPSPRRSTASTPATTPASAPPSPPQPRP
jgi:hypothetical protein